MRSVSRISPDRVAAYAIHVREPDLLEGCYRTRALAARLLGVPQITLPEMRGDRRLSVLLRYATSIIQVIALLPTNKRSLEELRSVAAQQPWLMDGMRVDRNEKEQIEIRISLHRHLTTAALLDAGAKVDHFWDLNVAALEKILDHSSVHAMTELIKAGGLLQDLGELHEDQFQIVLRHYRATSELLRAKVSLADLGRLLPADLEFLFPNPDSTDIADLIQPRIIADLYRSGFKLQELSELWKCRLETLRHYHSVLMILRRAEEPSLELSQLQDNQLETLFSLRHQPAKLLASYRSGIAPAFRNKTLKQE